MTKVNEERELGKWMGLGRGRGKDRRGKGRKGIKSEEEAVRERK